MTTLDGEVVGLRGVSVIHSGNLLLDGIDWRTAAASATADSAPCGAAPVFSPQLG